MSYRNRARSDTELISEVKASKPMSKEQRKRWIKVFVIGAKEIEDCCHRSILIHNSNMKLQVLRCPYTGYLNIIHGAKTRLDYAYQFYENTYNVLCESSSLK